MTDRCGRWTSIFQTIPMAQYLLVLVLPLSFASGQCVCACADDASSVSSAESVRVELSARPNIVIVYTDDQAAWAVGTAVQRGWFDDVAKAETPNIDRLANQGAIFRNFFCTTPVCSPARAAFMTGRYASEFGITDFIPQPDHKLFDAENQIALDPDRSVTFAEVLQQNGYQTGLVGKWHLGDWTANGNKRFHPTNHGFDYFMGLTGGGTRPNNPELEEEGEVREFTGLTIDILTDRALKFIERSRDNPFLLCLNTRAPHGAWLPVDPDDWKPYDGLDAKIPNPDYPDLNIAKMKKQMREYLASTTGVDRNIGRVLRLLDELRLAENTVVIFTSDHGYNMGHNGYWHKGNGIWATRQPPKETHRGTRVISAKYRPNLDDHSLRVPMIVRWPGVVKSGTKIDATATSLDLFPTVISMAGLAIPETLHLRGHSLLPWLKEETPPDWNHDLYAEYHMINYAHADLRCYRTPKFKLVVDAHNAGRNEFFDLQNDPGETRNLINDQRPEIQAVIKELTELLESTRSEIENAPKR
ncbi:MAG: sulfatase-like hydrolase/transferase [Pirellulaceae bacterium]